MKDAPRNNVGTNIINTKYPGYRSARVWYKRVWPCFSISICHTHSLWKHSNKPTVVPFHLIFWPNNKSFRQPHWNYSYTQTISYWNMLLYRLFLSFIFPGFQAPPHSVLFDGMGKQNQLFNFRWVHKVFGEHRGEKNCLLFYRII